MQTYTQVLHTLACTASPQVRTAFLHSQVAVALLQEFSLEAGVLSLEQQVIYREFLPLIFPCVEFDSPPYPTLTHEIEKLAAFAEGKAE